MIEVAYSAIVTCLILWHTVRTVENRRRHRVAVKLYGSWEQLVLICESYPPVVDIPRVHDTTWDEPLIQFLHRIPGDAWNSESGSDGLHQEIIDRFRPENRNEFADVLRVLIQSYRKTHGQPLHAAITRLECHQQVAVMCHNWREVEKRFRSTSPDEYLRALRRSDLTVLREACNRSCQLNEMMQRLRNMETALPQRRQSAQEPACFSNPEFVTRLLLFNRITDFSTSACGMTVFRGPV